MSSWLRQEPAPKSKRAALLLQAAIFTPLALVMAGAVVYAALKIAAGDGGHVVLLVVAGLLLLVLGYQAVHYLRDLNTDPASSEGEITKKWSKGNLFFFFVPSYYIAVKGKIYTVNRVQYRMLLAEDVVRIRHYPNSLTVEFIERYDSTEKKFVAAEPDGTVV